MKKAQDVDPGRCKKTPSCQLKVNHEGDCGGAVALLRAVAKKQGGRIVDYLARKAIKLLGGDAS